MLYVPRSMTSKYESRLVQRGGGGGGGGGRKLQGDETATFNVVMEISVLTADYPNRLGLGILFPYYSLLSPYYSLLFSTIPLLFPLLFPYYSLLIPY